MWEGIGFTLIWPIVFFNSQPGRSLNILKNASNNSMTKTRWVLGKEK
jgi:hypothetical protein